VPAALFACCGRACAGFFACTGRACGAFLKIIFYKKNTSFKKKSPKNRGLFFSKKRYSYQTSS
jgi:hypothetical protein